jgi:hypothetical protein
VERKRKIAHVVTNEPLGMHGSRNAFGASWMVESFRIVPESPVTVLNPLLVKFIRLKGRLIPSTS